MGISLKRFFTRCGKLSNSTKPPTPLTMNDQSPVPPQIPPIIPSVDARQLGGDPSERVAITNVVAAIDAILRHPRRMMFQLRQPGAGRLIGMMLLVSVVCSLIYGVVVGTFSGGAQLWIAPAKIAVGLMISALICLPSLYIFTCLSGSQRGSSKSADSSPDC